MAVGPDPNFAILPIANDPYTHVIVDEYLDPIFYQSLKDSFPLCPPDSGPTGFTLYWGDPLYDQLIADNPTWGQFFHLFHNQQFIDYCIAQFADEFSNLAKVDLADARYVPYQETRADKERRALAAPEHEADQLWVRVDIMQGRVGYDRQPHIDHRRRAITLLIYFCEAGEGGDLLLHGRNGDIHRVAPKNNRMVMFPCIADSVHSIDPIIAQSEYRNTVQVTVSSSVDLWDGRPETVKTLARKAFRRLFGRR